MSREKIILKKGKFEDNLLLTYATIFFFIFEAFVFPFIFAFKKYRKKSYFQRLGIIFSFWKKIIGLIIAVITFLIVLIFFIIIKNVQIFYKAYLSTAIKTR